MLKVVFQMDSIDLIDIDEDSTFALMCEAQKRGMQLYVYTPDRLSYEDDGLKFRGTEVQVFHKKGAHYKKGKENLYNIVDFDVVWLRQDPPFDMAYITNTHLLERVHPKPYIVNNPYFVRNAPEKISILNFPTLIPKTLITRDIQAIAGFRRKHKDIIIKPLYGSGGAGIFHIKPDDENLSALLEMFLNQSREPLMVQEYLLEIKQGDKRIILIDGEAFGAFNRRPQTGEARANLHVGGLAQKTVLTPRERHICETLKPFLQAQDLLFVGIDVIGGYLTEINVTSPTGLCNIEKLDGVNLAKNIWDCLEKKLK